MNMTCTYDSSHPASFDDTIVEPGELVTKYFLVNKLNYTNFQDRTIIINFKHTRYNNSISLKAKPLPCSGEELQCVWSGHHDLSHLLKSYTFSNLLIPEGKKLYKVIPEVLEITGTGLSLLLPETGREITTRKVKRHAASGITIQMTQNSVRFSGRLLDFSPVSFSAELTLLPRQTFEWVYPDSPVNLQLFSGAEILYSGECRIIRHDGGHTARKFAFEPVDGHIRRRFKPKQYRSSRQQLLPPPNIVFSHPFTSKTINLDVLNLSGTGFSVEEDFENSVLLPGMIIPDLEILVASSFRITCQAQVVYRNILLADDDEVQVRCGLAILDMDVNEHVRILSLLQQAANRNSHIGTTVDMDALWNFFFDTGFIYPEKYANFEINKKEIKKTYEKLYGQNPHIARHFIYQEKGKILGHMAMMRFQQDSWLIHHHAASKTESMRAGMVVLNQIGRFINDSHNMHSSHMNYVMCYFRPMNKFPDRIFGGVARNLKNPKACSMDAFAYFHAPASEQGRGVLPCPWEMVSAEPGDLLELEIFYEHESGGLMLDALNLRAGNYLQSTLADEYHSLGFKKERYLYSLKKEGRLKAIVIVNVSDIGLNMSNLTNCPTVIVLDEDVPRQILLHTVDHVAANYDGSTLPVLLYPPQQAMRCSILTEKLYSLWVLSMQHTDHYFGYLENLIKRIQH